jgi:acyl-CoA reductase-like NAD-dependent aldehyde dehydrogenase
VKPPEILDAIGRAAASFERTCAVPGWKRAEILRQIHDSIHRRKREFTDAIVREARKPVRFAAGEVERCLVTFRLAAEEATRRPGDVLPVDLDPRAESSWCVVERFPKGVVSALTPFNFPLNLLAHKVAPAIACGCTVHAHARRRGPSRGRSRADGMAGGRLRARRLRQRGRVSALA